MKPCTPAHPTASPGPFGTSLRHALANAFANAFANSFANSFANLFANSCVTASPLILAITLAGCASGPPPRDWQINAFEAQETALDTWLQGNDKLADAEFARARDAVASSARLDLLARLTLGRCAAQIASLNNLPAAGNPFCPEFTPLGVDARAEEKAYFDYLTGRWQGITPTLLPAQHRPLLALVASPPATANGANSKADPTGKPAPLAADAQLLSAISDPLSRLVACGVLLQRGQLSPDGIALAVDTASTQGWRRPLLAWLGVQGQRAEATGNAELAARVKRRMAFLAPAK